MGVDGGCLGWTSDLFEDVHAQVGGEVGDRLSTQISQRHLGKGLCAQGFALFVAFQTHILKEKQQTMQRM